MHPYDTLYRDPEMGGGPGSYPGSYPGELRDAYDVVDGEMATRLTHQVYVDGRLVETWSEAVTGTRWEHHAQRFDRESHRPEPVTPVPTYERALRWLDDVCGGREAVLAMTSQPLREDGLDVPEAPTPQAQSRLGAVAELLDATAERWFDAETSFALRAALLGVWADEPEVVLDAATAAHVAGGICWVVGKANALYRPQGDLTMGRVREALALHPSISTYGKVVQRALVGYREASATGYWRPEGLPDLLATGRADILLAQVRRRLVRVRDRALAAQKQASSASEPERADLITPAC